MEVRLPDVCEIQYGFAFDSAQFSTTTGTPLIRIRDVVRGYSETYTTEKYNEEYLVNNGDLLIGMDGEFNIARWNGGQALLNQRVCRLFPKNSIDKGYLFYFMPQALKQIEEKTPFATVKHLSAKQLNAIVIPLPTIEAQQRISFTLDKITNLISLRKQQLAKLDELVKARFVEMFGDLEVNPNGFMAATLQMLIDQGYIIYHLDGNHGSDYPKSEEFTDTGIPYIGANCIKSGTIDFALAKHLPPERANQLRKGIAQNNDVLFCA